MQCRMLSQGRNSLAPERENPNQCSTIGEANARGKNAVVPSERRGVSVCQYKYCYTHIQTANTVPQTKDPTKYTPQIPSPLPDGEFQIGPALNGE